MTLKLFSICHLTFISWPFRTSVFHLPLRWQFQWHMKNGK